MDGKRILVTGGAGYLGCALCPLLAEQGAQVRVFDRLYFGSEGLLSVLKSDDFELIEGDMRAIERFPGILDDVWAVVHLASLANDPSCDLSPTMAEDINHTASVKLAEMARSRGVERFVFASSCSVYGASGEKLVSELSPLSPVSLYARLKIRSERALFGMVDERFCVTALRQATLFGYSPRMRFDLAINLMTMSAVVKHEITVLGGGNQWRPFVHVRDAARAILAVLSAEREEVSSQIFNVGSNSLNLKISDLAKLVAAEVPDTAVSVAPDDADRRSYRVRFDRIQRHLGYETTITPEEGVSELSKAIQRGDITEPYDSRYFNVMHLKRLMSIPTAEGGETPRTKPLKNYLPAISSADRERVSHDLETVATGAMSDPVSGLANMLSETFDASGVVLLHSHYLAVLGAFLLLDRSLNKRIVLHPFVDARVFAAASQLGLTPVICDIDGDTLCFDLTKLETLVDEGVAAVFAGSILDIPEPLAALSSLLDEAGCPLLVDTQNQMGAMVMDRDVASFGALTTVDFGVDQNVTALGGGAILLQDASRKERCLDLLSCRLAEGPAPFVERQLGLSVLSAMLAMSNLERLYETASVRRHLQDVYDEALCECPYVRLVRSRDGVKRSGSRYPVFVDFDRLEIDAWQLERFMKQEKIECSRGKDCAVDIAGARLRGKTNRRASNLAQQISDLRSQLIFLPLHSEMNADDVNDAAFALQKIVNHFAR
ncbi:MAG: NAD-dependent epimerase/dehydratase family protein [Candidatus Coatesbacteria bacterium]|nr:NAD-dependent epimerase/dehydratase family protein [Candidatus Coatesbacteria bacterium]